MKHRIYCKWNNPTVVYFIRDLIYIILKMPPHGGGGFGGGGGHLGGGHGGGTVDDYMIPIIWNVHYDYVD